MTEPGGPESPASAPEPEQPEYVIEPARSGRAKCKTCRRPIPKDALRLGILIEGPYGTGYLWHHIKCAAKRHLPRLEEAYAQRSWADGVEVPSLDSLAALADKDAKKKAERKQAPHAEPAPTGRAACKACGEPIPKGSFRVVMVRRVEFGNQVRHSPVNIHPGCVTRELEHEECGIEREGFADALRANSRGVDAADLDRVLGEIGPVDA